MSKKTKVPERRPREPDNRTFGISLKVNKEKFEPMIESRVKELGCSKNAFYEFAVRLLLLEVDEHTLNVWEESALKAVIRRYCKK